MITITGTFAARVGSVWNCTYSRDGDRVSLSIAVWGYSGPLDLTVTDLPVQHYPAAPVAIEVLDGRATVVEYDAIPAPPEPAP